MCWTSEAGAAGRAPEPILAICMNSHCQNMASHDGQNASAELCRPLDGQLGKLWNCRKSLPNVKAKGIKSVARTATRGPIVMRY